MITSRFDNVVLFDGECALCNGTVRFIADRDGCGLFRFAPLRSETARRLLEAAGYEPTGRELSSLVLIEEGRYYLRSSAALRIALRLDGMWPLLYAGIVVPRPLRDAVYDWIASNRYRWFGKTCRIPSEDLRARFLET